MNNGKDLIYTAQGRPAKIMAWWDGQPIWQWVSAGELLVERMRKNKPKKDD